MNPYHIPNIRYKNGKKVLYLKILKTLYGYIESAILWYDLYVYTLKELVFVINPYDRCVENKGIDEKQCTICWYVYKNKVSPVNPKVNTMIIEAFTIILGV